MSQHMEEVVGNDSIVTCQLISRLFSPSKEDFGDV